MASGLFVAIVSHFLQWSHDLSAMDTTAARLGVISVTALQWSHDLSAMDTIDNIARQFVAELPSMEP